MANRQEDTRGRQTYLTVYPGSDLKKNPIAVEEPQLVEAVGLDGRFLGALRPFPGMADKTIHGVPTPTAGLTITSISNIVFANYVSIQKGNSGDTLKGIAYIADNQAGGGQAIYFAYRDSSDNSEDVVMLEDFDSWDDFKLTSIAEYDITSQGRYIYFCASGDTTSTVSQLNGTEPPYNKAYFWDYKINTTDKFVTGFDGRFMSLLPQRTLVAPLNVDDDGTFAGVDSEDLMATQVYGPTGASMAAGPYVYAVELISRKHNLRSWFRYHNEDALGSASSGLRYFINRFGMPTDTPSTATNQVSGNTHNHTGILNWGIPHVDGCRLWRSPRNSLGNGTDKYTLTDQLYLVDEYKELNANITGSTTASVQVDHDPIIGTVFNDFKSTWFEGGGLIQQTQYNPFLHIFSPAPRFKRLQAYDGLLVGITDVEEPASPNALWEDQEKKPDAIAWSSVVNTEPENFPPENQYRADDAGEKFFVLEPTGDHLFAISNSGVYRVSRSGSQVGTNRIQFRLGGVSRFGATGIGNTLFIVTSSGVKSIEGNTGQLDSVTVLDRIILDDSEWAGTLTSVHLEYDAKLGALILLNTSKSEMYIMWESTGAITKVENVPWAFLTAGPDVLTDGPQRAYFITSTGGVHVIDGAREMGKRTMCGTTAVETVNGTVTSGSTDTNLEDTAATFPVNCEGFTVHILSGDRKDESATISTRVSATDLTISGLSGTLSTGDRYSIAPIVTRITLWQVQAQDNEVDPFVRKTAVSTTASFSDLGGETGSGDDNGFFNYGFKNMNTIMGRVETGLNLVPDKTAAHTPYAATRLFPFLEFKGSNQDWELQAIMVKGILGVSEAESRQN